VTTNPRVPRGALRESRESGVFGRAPQRPRSQSVY